MGLHILFNVWTRQLPLLCFVWHWLLQFEPTNIKTISLYKMALALTPCISYLCVVVFTRVMNSIRQKKPSLDLYRLTKGKKIHKNFVIYLSLFSTIIGIGPCIVLQVLYMCPFHGLSTCLYFFFFEATCLYFWLPASRHHLITLLYLYLFF